MNNQYGYYMPQGGNYYPQQNMMMNPNQPVKPPKKKKIWLFFLIIAIVVMIGGFLIWKLLSPKREKYTYETLTETTSFFLPNEEEYYALFNEEGEKLTDFEFESVGEFYGGVAKVKREDGKSAIIRENGSYLMDFTEDTIEDYQSLFLISPKEGTPRLINYAGKKILESETLKVSTFYDSSLFIVSTGEDTVKIMNYKGDVLDELKNMNFSKSPNVIHGIVSLIGNKKSYLYNLDTGKKMYEIDGNYCVTRQENNSMVLSSCSTSDSLKNHKLFQNGKELYSVGKYLCSTVEIAEDGSFICKSANSNIYHLMDADGSLREEIVAAYHNGKDYVVKNGINAIFYVDGQERYRTSCVNVEGTTKGGYIIKNYTYGECTEKEPGTFYYNKAGEKISSSFYQVSDWDENGRAIVASKANNVYLVNDKLQKVSGEYRAIFPIQKLYIGMDEKKNYKLFTLDQKEIEQGFKSYKSTDNEPYKMNFLALLYDDSIVLYNSTTGEKISSNPGNNVLLSKHYYQIDGNYYSYRTGKQFYGKE